MKPTLANVLREKADAIERIDGAGESLGDRDYRLDVAELVRVLARVVEGKPIEKAFGAPGDWGYGTPIGDGLLGFLREVETTTTATQPPFAATTGSEAQPEEFKLLCVIEGADSTAGTITLRSPVSIAGIRIGDMAVAILKRYPVPPNH